jgi:hypothetical protein
MGKKKRDKGRRCKACGQRCGPSVWADGERGYELGESGPMGPGRNPGQNAGGILRALGLGGSRQTEQFLLGALVGAGATYVLSNEELRDRILKGVLKVYTDVTGGLEEMKERAADLRAEVEAERSGRD